MVNRLRNDQGLTLMEILIAVVLVSLVFTAAISLYTSGIKQLKARQAVDVTTSPDIFLEQVAKKISIASAANMAPATQLNIRVDQDCAGAALATPSNTTDDNWWHFRPAGTELLAFCDNVPGTVLTSIGNPVGTTSLISNLDTATSNFAIINPSATGNPTVISMHIVSTNPIMTVDTEAALGASPKR